MELKDAYKATRIIESLENFAVTHDKSLSPPTNSSISKNVNKDFYDDGSFWMNILNRPDDYWGEKFSFHEVTLSEWVPRVPGLFFSDGSRALRAASKNYIEIKSPRWVQFHPPGKSAIVLGGIGTFVLPRGAFGNRMMSISHSCNASTGIPVLISDDIRDHYLLNQGDCLHITDARWVKLTAEWAQRFPSIKGIPRGCIALNEPGLKISKSDNPNPTEFHPFTIMQYETRNTLLYDYVFLTVDTMEKNYRSEMEHFFENYRVKDGRNGRYLIQVDMNNPLFEATYNTPDELLRQNQYGESQLRLITKRLKDIYFNGNTITELIDFINSHYFLQDDLTALCIQANINPGFLSGNSVAEKAIVLLDYCIEKNIVEQLVDSIAIKYPEIVN